MKRFQFRLARVLRVRRIEEQAARATFLEQHALAREAQESSARALEQRQLMESQLTDQVQSGPIDPRSAIRAQDSIDGMGHVCRRRRNESTALSLQAAQAREPWVETRVDVRALERLEDRMRERHLSSVEKQANRELDETAARRAALPARAKQARAKQQEERSK